MPEVMFAGPDGRLEGRYHHSKEPGAPVALVLHPHPLHGGTMNNRITFTMYQSFMRLGVTDTNGWNPPVVKPGEDFIDKTRDAFVAWLAGAGKDYRINKFVAKKK